MFEIICDKYDKKGNHKLSNLLKKLESCTLRNTKVETDDSYTYLFRLRNSIENTIIEFKKTEK